MLGDDEHSYEVHPLLDDEQSPTVHGETVALSELLNQSTGISLTRRQRYCIALTIASSQLQLQSTPWLGRQWSKNDVVFLRDQKRPNSILFDRPRLSRSFSKADDDALDVARDGDRSITTLGIVLLELCFGTSLENHPVRQGYPFLEGETKYYLDLAAAIEWSEHINEEAGPEFAGAVTWCLQRNSAAVVTNENWRAELYANVVKPLQDCHQHLV